MRDSSRNGWYEYRLVERHLRSSDLITKLTDLSSYSSTFMMRSSILRSIALFSLSSQMFAQNVSQLTSGSTTCNATCQQMVEEGIAFEHDSHAHTPLDDFYSVPVNFSTSMEPGTVLKVEIHTDLVNYTVPAGLSMSRIMYTSQTLNGTIVPVTAFVLWPYAPFEYANSRGKKSTGSPKFPMVAWTHGTAGLFSDCAPSNYRSLQYHFMTSYALALEGFAVVATDYAGLGVDVPGLVHEYLAGPAAANDGAFSVVAARTAFPDLFEKEGPFVCFGHSQGGNTAWAFAERQAKFPLPGYRGTIAISPAIGRVTDLVPKALQAAAAGAKDPASIPIWVFIVLGLQTKFIASVNAVYPAYNYSGFTPLSYDRWVNVLKPTKACLATESLLATTVGLDQLAQPNWTTNHFVQEWQGRAVVGEGKFAGPLLVLSGGNDAIPVFQVDQAVKSACAKSPNQDLEEMIYLGTEHFPAIQTSHMKWMNWIKEKISGPPGYSGHTRNQCGRRSETAGFNQNYTVHGVPPNWIAEWVPLATDGWKLSL